MASEIPIDWEYVKQLLMYGCSQVEISSQLGIHRDTLANRTKKEFDTDWLTFSTSHREKGDILLKEAQFKKAVEKLDNTLLIWLGKIRLGQNEYGAISTVPAKQSEIDKDHMIMRQAHEIVELKKVINENTSK